MSLTVGELNAKLSLDSSAFDRGLDGSESKFRGFAGKLGTLAAGAGIAIGAAVSAAAVKGVASFAGLESGMNEVFTLLPGISEDAMAEMTDQVKDFAREFAVVPDEVVPALYQSLSAGVPPDNVFDFLETAQMAARGGVTELATAVDGISSVINAYGTDVLSASEASDLMFTAVRLGKTNFEELSASLFQVIPTASSLGVEFGDVTAALASMTAQGTPTSVATTQLRQALVELSKDGTKTSDLFKEVSGKTFRDFIKEGGNLEDALQIMTGAAGDMGVSVSDLFGSVEAGNAVLALTSDTGAEAFSRALREMDSSAGATEAANAQMAQGIGYSFERIKAAVAVGLAEFGEKLAPTIQAVIDWVEENWPRIQETISESMEMIRAVVEPVVEWLTAFWEENGAEILAFAADTWASIQEVIDAAMEFIRALIDRVTIIIQAIWETHGEKILEFLGTLWEHIKTIVDTTLSVIRGIFETFAALFRGDWEGVWNGVKGIVDDIWTGIQSTLETGWEALSLAWTILTDGIATAWDTVWGGIKDGIGTIWDGITAAVKTGVNGMIGFVEWGLNKLVDGVNAAIGGLDFLAGPFVNFGELSHISLPRLHRGGTVPGVPGSEMLAILRAGERVVDSGASVLPGGTGGGGGVSIQVTTPTKEAREIAQEIRWAQAYELRIA